MGNSVCERATLDPNVGGSSLIWILNYSVTKGKIHSQGHFHQVWVESRVCKRSDCESLSHCTESHDGQIHFIEVNGPERKNEWLQSIIQIFWLVLDFCWHTYVSICFSYCYYYYSANIKAWYLCFCVSCLFFIIIFACLRLWLCDPFCCYLVLFRFMRCSLDF